MVRGFPEISATTSIHLHREGIEMQRFFLIAMLGAGLLATSYPAGASQTVAPCHKKCMKYQQDDSRSAYGKCRDACAKGEVYNVPVNKGSAASPAPLSKGETAETYRRLRELQKSKAEAAEAKANRRLRELQKSMAEAAEAKANAMEVLKRRRPGQSASSGDGSSSLKETLGDVVKGSIKRALEGLAGK